LDTKFRIHANDNVAVILGEVPDIAAGHKVAISAIAEGQPVIKYGYPIGRATTDIALGEWVHTHNLKTNLEGILEYNYQPQEMEQKVAESGNVPTFMGYRRSDGKAGIRNEIWIVNTVGCVNKIAEKIERAAQSRYLSNITSATNKVDGIYTFVHPFGCSQLGDDHTYTQMILKNMVNHPNAAGVLVLGLGCENNNIPEFQKLLGTWDENRVIFLNTQDVEDEVEAGLECINKLVLYAEKFKREPIPVSELVVGLKCGGSDGFSGITANPLAGHFSDRLISYGGTSILTEVPEMFGAETILMNRCTNEGVFDKTVNLINDFKGYFTRHNQAIYENPSPGNKDGGISTLEEKSLGCTTKGGTSPVIDVLNYGETVQKPGLCLLQGPGNDIVAVTNLMAAGAHMVLFTTGRGTPLGAPVPTVKISSNSTLAKNKPHWIDFNAGELLEGTDMPTLSNKFFDYIVSVASGTVTVNEVNGYREISIFKDGVTL